MIVPTGATEQHGPHGPLLTDVLIPQEIARRIAPTIGAVVAPPINYALSYPHVGFTGLVHIRISTFMALIEDLCVSFATSGFKRIIFSTATTTTPTRSPTAAPNAAEKLAKDVKAFPVNYWDALTAEEIDEWSGLEERAAREPRRDVGRAGDQSRISWTWSARTPSSRRSRSTRSTPGPSTRRSSSPRRGRCTGRRNRGTWGDARKSTAEAGERYLEAGVRSTLAVLDNIEQTFAAMPPR